MRIPGTSCDDPWTPDRTAKRTGAYYRPGLMPTDDAQLLARISSDATGEALRALYKHLRR